MEVPLRPDLGPLRDVSLLQSGYGAFRASEVSSAEETGHSAPGGCFLPCPKSSGLHILTGGVHRDDRSQLEMQERCTAGLHHHSSTLRLHFGEALSKHICFSHPQLQNGRATCSAFVVGEKRTLYRITLELSAQNGGASALAKVSASDVSSHNINQQMIRFGAITCLTSGASWFCLGGQSGNILCMPFGGSQNGAEVMTELQGSEGMMNRLWDLVGRGKAAGPVETLAVRTFGDGDAAVHGVIAGHRGGMLRVWNVQQRHLLLSCSLLSQGPTLGPGSWWFEETLNAVSELHLARCYPAGEDETQLAVYKLIIETADQGININIPSETPTIINLPKGEVLDANLLHGVLWVLLVPPESPATSSPLQRPPAPVLVRVPLATPSDVMLECRLLEQQLASKLLLDEEYQQNIMFFQDCHQNPALADMDVADIIVQHITAPGIFYKSEFLSLLKKHQRAAHEISDLTTLKDELKAAAAQLEKPEGSSDSEEAIEMQNWRHLSLEYLQIWQKAHKPCCLLGDAASGCLVVIRHTSVSLLRDLDDVEELLEPLRDMSVGEEKGFSTPTMHWQKCSNILRLELGSLAMAALEVVQPNSVSLVKTLLRILEIGFCEGKQYSSRQIQEEEHCKQRVRFRQLTVTLKSLERLTGGWKTALDSLEACLETLQWPSPSTQMQEDQTMKSWGNSGKSCWLTWSLWQVEGARVRAARDLTLLLAYIAEQPSQVGLSFREASRLQLQLLPRAQELLGVAQLQLWLTEMRPILSPDDRLSGMSSLGIDGGKNVFAGGRLEEHNLADLILSQWPHQLEAKSPSPQQLCQATRQGSSCLRWGEPSAMPGVVLPLYLQRATQVADMLMNHGQSAHVETFLSHAGRLMDFEQFWQPANVAEQDAKQKAIAQSAFLLGRATLAAAEHATSKDVPSLHARSVAYFFRALEGVGNGPEADHFFDPGQHQPSTDLHQRTLTRWHYFDLVIQMFMRCGLRDARQFVYASLTDLEKLDSNSETINLINRHWGNIFTMALKDLRYEEAFCAILHNQDERLQRSYLKRLIDSLFDHQCLQLLCGPELPYGSFGVMVGEELMHKAEVSDVNAKPNAYEVLYSFHNQHHNWRGAALAVYSLANRLKLEAVGLEALEQREQSLAAALAALEHLPPRNSWLTLESTVSVRINSDVASPKKRLRATEEPPANASKRLITVSYEDVQKEHTLAAALVQLAFSDTNQLCPSLKLGPQEAVHALSRAGLFSAALSLAPSFWTGSALNSHLEEIFKSMTRYCCSVPSFSEPAASHAHSTPGETSVAWQQLREQLEKYGKINGRLKDVVASTVLTVDRRIQLPQWLVGLFKDDHAGDIASLLRIFLDADLLVNATTLALEFLESSSRKGPLSAEVQRRKTLGGSWMPYSALNLLRSRLFELVHHSRQDLSGTDMKALLDSLDEALCANFKQVKIESEDLKAMSMPRG